MLKKTIKFTDYNDVEREEDFYFNLTKAELMEMEYSTTGGFTEMMNKIITTKDVPMIMNVFKDLILRSYGEKSADGKRFIKNQELRDSFEQTEAYSILFMELSSDADSAAKFVNGIIPKELAQQAQEQAANNK